MVTRERKFKWFNSRDVDIWENIRRNKL